MISSILKLKLMTVVGASHSANAALLDEPIQPITQILKQDPVRAGIGRLRFRDTRLSGNGRVSCASCHDLSNGGGDGRAHSMGLNGELTGVKAPAAFNAALNFKQFWKGHANSLEMQADQVMQNPAEMGSQGEEVVQKVSQDAKSRSAFAVACKDAVSRSNIQNAIVTYVLERTCHARRTRVNDGTITTPWA